MAKKCLTGHGKRVPEAENGRCYLFLPQRHQRPRSEAEAAQTFFKVSKNAKFKCVVVAPYIAVSTAMRSFADIANRPQESHLMFESHLT